MLLQIFSLSCFLTLSCRAFGISNGGHVHPERAPVVPQLGEDFDIPLLNFTQYGKASANAKSNVNSSFKKDPYKVVLEDDRIKNSSHKLDLNAKAQLEFKPLGAELVAENIPTNDVEALVKGRSAYSSKPGLMKSCHTHSQKFIEEEKQHSELMGVQGSTHSTSVVPQNSKNSTTKEARQEVMPLLRSSFANPYPTVKNIMIQDDFKPWNSSLDSSNPDDSDSPANYKETPWLDLITSPLVKKALKYLVTDFYPKKILDTVNKRWKAYNSTDRSQGTDVSPSVVYPLLMEGVSIIVNRLTEDDSNSTVHNEPDSAIKGQIVNGVIESLNKLLKASRPEESASPATDHVAETTTFTNDVLNSNTLNKLLPLVENVPRNDIQTTINGLLGMISGNSAMPRISSTDLNRIMSHPKVLRMLLQKGSSLGSLPGLQSSTALSEILKKPTALSAALGDKSDLGNLTNIISRFLPGKISGQGLSPKNPLLRLGFAAKVLAKSPVAHLGALDDNIKRLITNSLERAVSRVKINEKGELQMNEGMMKALGKMMADGPIGQNRTSDALMDVLKSAIASGSVKVEHSNATDDEKPVVKRNVTRHSHLHRKFYEKYGRFYQNSSVEATSCSLLVPFVLPVITILIK